MTRLIPKLSESELKKLENRSNAERLVYEACQRLGDDYLVIFSFAWIKQTIYGGHRDGETDFIVFHPNKGILHIEVKGGGIRYSPESGSWTSLNRNGVVKDIKNPFRQALESKYAFLEFLHANEEWGYLCIKPLMGHAVIFPEIADAKPLAGPERPVEIIGTQHDVARIRDWVDSVFKFWADSAGPSPEERLGSKGMGFIERTFCRDIYIRPLLSTILKEEEDERIRLTEQQKRLMTALRHQKRLAISGGAGTGKTVLAFQRAREIAQAGDRTLLICYNQLLSEHLFHEATDVPLLNVMSFHQLCHWTIKCAKMTGYDALADARSANPGASEMDVVLPYAMDLALERVTNEFTALIIDEAQDFKDEYWLPIDSLIQKVGDGVVIILYDHNQRIFSRSDLFPIDGQPIVLTQNCRNTDQIHQVAYRFYRGEPTESSSITGSAIEFISGPSRSAQARRLHSHLVDLLSKERVSPTDICVLVPSQGSESYFQELKTSSLPTGTQWGFHEYNKAGKICVETMMRFKGLEATYIYVWGADELSDTHDTELLYVTLSRAKSRLCLVGNEAICRELVGAS